MKIYGNREHRKNKFKSGETEKLEIIHEHEMKMIKLRDEHELARLKREQEFALKELERKHELKMLKMRGGWFGKIFGCS